MPQEWYLQTGPQPGLTQAQLASCSVGTCQLIALSVTSERLSANALSNSISIQTPAAATANLGSSALGSTEYVIWRAPVNVFLNRIQIVPQAAWVNPSDACVLNFGNSCAVIASYTVCTCNLSLGTRVDVGALTNAAIAAGTDLRFNVMVCTTSSGNAPAHAIQIDYVTSG